MSTSSKYQWKEGNIGTEYYHDDEGLIVGKVTRTSFSDDTYIAEANRTGLGEYISQKAAKKAVEKAISNKSIFDMRPVSDDFDPRGGYNGIGEQVAQWSEQYSWPAFSRDPSMEGIAGGSSIPDIARDSHLYPDNFSSNVMIDISKGE